MVDSGTRTLEVILQNAGAPRQMEITLIDGYLRICFALSIAGSSLGWFQPTDVIPCRSVSESKENGHFHRSLSSP